MWPSCSVASSDTGARFSGRARSSSLVGSEGIGAGVAKLADARDSKSRSAQTECGFDPRLRHQLTTSPTRWSTDFGISRCSHPFEPGSQAASIRV